MSIIGFVRIEVDLSGLGSNTPKNSNTNTLFQIQIQIQILYSYICSLLDSAFQYLICLHVVGIQWVFK